MSSVTLTSYLSGLIHRLDRRPPLTRLAISCLIVTSVLGESIFKANFLRVAVDTILG